MKKELSYQEFINLSQEEFVKRKSTYAETILYIYKKNNSEGLSKSDLISISKKYHTVGEYFYCFDLIHKVLSTVVHCTSIDSEEFQLYFDLTGFLCWLFDLDFKSLITDFHTFLDMAIMLTEVMELLEKNGYDLEEFYLADAGISSDKSSVLASLKK